MMLNTIKAALDSLALADWRITEVRRRGSETYFIKRRQDLCRAIEAVDYKVTLYVDGEERGRRVRGEATVSVHPTMEGAELTSILEKARFAATRIKNPSYTLPTPAPALIDFPLSAFSARPPVEWMEPLREALYRADGRDGALINSLELYLTAQEIHILNSRGLDVSWKGHRGYIEYVVEARGPEGSVELMDDCAFSEPDFDRLSAELAAHLALVRDRAVAQPLPTLAKLPLLVTGKAAEDLLEYFFLNAQASRVYTKASPYAIGAAVLGGEPCLENLELRAEAFLPGNPASTPFDADGIPLAPRPLIDQGRLVALSGPARYGAYLGLAPSGDFPLFSVAPGSASPEELRAAPHLETAMFSDFYVDPNSGDFGGELRLAYWFDGNRRLPVTGGSVSGNLVENFPCLRLSSRLCQGARASVPESMLLPWCSITGAE